jgi:hypothetical protein
MADGHVASGQGCSPGLQRHVYRKDDFFKQSEIANEMARHSLCEEIKDKV